MKMRLLSKSSQSMDKYVIQDNGFWSLQVYSLFTCDYMEHFYQLG